MDKDNKDATANNGDDVEIQTPTFQVGGIGNDNSMMSSDEKVRRRFMSKHKMALNHIAVDSVEARKYSVRGAHAKNNSSLEPLMMRLKEKSCSDWTQDFFPCARWLQGYDWKTTFMKDLMAGCTVGVMIVPQSMSYAKLAGLPVEFGLYSALVPVYAYALFGSSRQLAVGPVALVSLLLSNGLSQVMEKQGYSIEDESYQPIFNRLAIQTAFLVGVMNIAMGLLRLGFVTIFLSHAVISGFTTGAAVIIGMSQVKYIFGYEVARSKRFHEVLANILANLEDFNWRTFVMGTMAIFALVLLKNLGKTYKNLKFLRALGPLTVTAFAIILTVIFDLEHKGIPIVGTIPKGLPKVTIGDWLPMDVGIDSLAVVVISIVIVGFMESIAIGKTLASKHKYEIDASQELIGLGMANLMGGAFHSYPVTGSFSRSAVNNESGAESGISGMITATMVAVVLLLLTPVFEKLPLSILAAIVISGVLGLLDYPEAIHLWHVHKFDFGVWLTACLGTMFLGVETGLGIAVGVSLLIVIYEAAYPHTSVMGRLPGTSIYRNVKQYQEAERYDGIVVVRIESALFFANAQNVRDKIRKYRLAAQADLQESNGTVKYLVLELSPVGRIDTSALHILQDMYETYLERGQQMIFCNPNVAVMERFIQSGFADIVGDEHFFASVHDAVSFCLNEMDCEAISLHESTHGFDSSQEGDNGVVVVTAAGTSSDEEEGIAAADADTNT